MDQTLIWTTGLISSFGYVGLGLSLIVNCLGLPIASEMTLPLAGIAINLGDFDPTLTFVTVMLGQMVGFVIAYLIARHAGVGLIEKYGHYMFISHRQIVICQRLFQKHGPLIMLIGLCVPGVHGYMGYSAGLAKMRIHLFLLLALIGTAVWSAGLLGLGYLFGDRLPQIMEFGNKAGLASSMVIASVALIFWYSRHRSHKATPHHYKSRRSTPVATKLR